MVKHERVAARTIAAVDGALVENPVSMRIVSARGALLTALALAVVGGCGVSDEPPSGGDPRAVAQTTEANAPVVTPAPETVTLVSHELPAPQPVAPAGTDVNVTYGDAERVYRTGRYAEAAELFGAYTLRKPENVWGHYMLGISAWKSGDHEGAESALRRTIELDPKHGKAHVNLARIFLEENRPAAALDYAEEGVALSPASAGAWRVLANVRSALGAVDEAVEAYQRALVVDHGDAWSMNNLGLLMIRHGRYEEAMPALARATELEPTVATFQNNLGVALERSGHLVEAADAFRAALEVAPGYGKAEESLARVEMRIVDGDWAPVDLKSLAAVFADEIVFWRERFARADSSMVRDTTARSSAGRN